MSVVSTIFPRLSSKLLSLLSRRSSASDERSYNSSFAMGDLGKSLGSLSGAGGEKISEETPQLLGLPPNAVPCELNATNPDTSSPVSRSAVLYADCATTASRSRRIVWDFLVAGVKSLEVHVRGRCTYMRDFRKNVYDPVRRILYKGSSSGQRMRAEIKWILHLTYGP